MKFIHDFFRPRYGSSPSDNIAEASEGDGEVVVAAVLDEEDNDLPLDQNIHRTIAETSAEESTDQMNCQNNTSINNSETEVEEEPQLENPDMPSARMNGKSISGIVKKQMNAFNKRNVTDPGDIKTLVGKGILWERSRVNLHSHIKPSDMENGWESFFQLDIFH